jgi:hypothetical protein
VLLQQLSHPPKRFFPDKEIYLVGDRVHHLNRGALLSFKGLALLVSEGNCHAHFENL